MQLNTRKTNNPIKQMGGRPKYTLLQRRLTDGQQAHEKMLNITIRELQIKPTMRCHVTPIRMAIIKKSTNKNAREGVEKMELSCTVGGNVN